MDVLKLKGTDILDRRLREKKVSHDELGRGIVRRKSVWNAT